MLVVTRPGELERRETGIGGMDLLVVEDDGLQGGGGGGGSGT